MPVSQKTVCVKQYHDPELVWKKILGVQVSAVKPLEAVMSGVFIMPNGNRKQNEWL